jgi:hypothetical protein
MGVGPMSGEEAYARDLGPLRCCNRCLEFKERSLTNFFRDSDGPQGWSRSCKPCDREYQRQRREEVAIGKRQVKPVRPGDGRLASRRQRTAVGVKSTGP